MLTSSSLSEEPELRNIVASTAAVVFLGTPHRGSQDMAGAGEIARKVASILMMDTSSTMLDALGLKTSDLERCQESFSRLWREYDFRVKTFQEGFPLTAVNLGLLNEKVSRYFFVLCQGSGLGRVKILHNGCLQIFSKNLLIKLPCRKVVDPPQVVPDYSSTLGDPRERAEPLDANHMQMCRIFGPNDPNYRKVAGEIRVLYQSVANIKPDTKNSGGRVNDDTGVRKMSLSERGASSP